MISLQQIRKSFSNKDRENAILKSCNLEVKDGDFISILGKSGSGKTTLLNVIGLLDNFDSGSYDFNGIDVGGLKEKERNEIRLNNISYVFQDFKLIEEFTAIENAYMPLGYRGVKKRERISRAKEILSKVGLEDKFYEEARKLSGGQKQRLALARAMITRPKLLILDEPTGNLDEKTAEDMAQLLIQANIHGTTMVMVTHDLDLARIANKKFILKGGRLSKI